IGYNIVCAFSKILQKSTISAQVSALGITGVVPAFHRHSHNWPCQVNWHPLYTPGIGKEDSEGCK
ncbi:hypothetical protein C8Q70DRAFT_918646, partial [Cubamyces menziesii]